MSQLPSRLEGLIGIMLPNPLPEFTFRFVVFNSNKSKSKTELLPDTSPIEIDHFSPSTRINILFTVGINFIHGFMSVTEDHRLNFWLIIQKLTSGTLQIEHKICFFFQNFCSGRQTRPPSRTIDKTSFQKIK